MRVTTIIYDNTALVLLLNMQKLKINPEEVEDIFISHLHRDHIGGLSSFLALCQ